ncbi:acetate uptake transporter [Phytoactinopolyspora halotolerans]|uniref:Acetate uptake transporter n=1 Tax=Phytoactinopolyspora halotolerans TaxID=1981512 RepID=A0A6L9SBS2_9ACTN|nr:GPR1/FUN34/YaaH family transporter [Phytoactinopolyspora halotolerans]NEE02052.1 hypothetical protein [Phytoactinopolyspora halotolerans]
MSTAETSRRPSGNGDLQYWRDHTQVALQPVAAPSILGLFAFAGATFIVTAHMAGWYGDSTSPQFLFPFAAMFGGVAQLLAGMWSYRARDALATAMHGTWGSFWIGYGILYTLVATGVLTEPATFVELGYWFIALAAITWVGAIAALAENISLFLTLGALAAGATLAAIAFIGGNSTVETTAGWVFLASAALAFYTASSMLLEATYKRVILPLGRLSGANKPGQPPREVIQFEHGEPGVKVGQ